MPTEQAPNVLSIGATGSIGQLVVKEALARGHHVRALVRDPKKVQFPAGTEVVIGDLTKQADVARALDGIDAVVFTMGSHVSAEMIQRVDYGAVRNALDALAGRPVRIALMTAIGVTNMDSPYNTKYEAHDWKRRSEWLVRASGNVHTIVRPGWFDYNAPDELHLQFLQGDTRRAASPEDGVVSRRQIAQVLVSALTCPEAANKTLELVAVKGPAQDDLSGMFGSLAPDSSDTYDATLDEHNFPMEAQPEAVVADLHRIAGYRAPR